MTHPYVLDMGSLQSDLGQPLIGIITAQDGDDVVRYFTGEAEADQGTAQNAAEEALALAGAWRRYQAFDMRPFPPRRFLYETLLIG
jgi:hypothetical protein